jgi:hypothetical protein
MLCTPRSKGKFKHLLSAQCFGFLIDNINLPDEGRIFQCEDKIEEREFKRLRFTKNIPFKDKRIFIIRYFLDQCLSGPWRSLGRLLLTLCFFRFR